MCASGRLTAKDEEIYLLHYLDALTPLLVAQGEEPPPLERLKQSYEIALCDLARWMCGCKYGWWGHARMLRRRVEGILDLLDGGSALESAEAYQEAIFSNFAV